MAPLASPELTGTPTAPTATAGTNTTQVATTAFVKAAVDAAVTGSNGTTQSANDNSTKLATTAYVDRADALKANLDSPTFTGTPLAPTASVGTNTTQVATTAFVESTLEATTVTVGAAGTSKGNGVRIGNARFTVNKPTAPTKTTSSSDQTLTNTMILDAGIYVWDPGASGKKLIIPTAKGSSGLVQALPNATVGDVFTLLVVNSSTTQDYQMSTNSGEGNTIQSGTITIGKGTSRVLYFRVTSISNNNEAISIY